MRSILFVFLFMRLVLSGNEMPTIGVVGVTIPGAVDCIQKINRSSSQYFGAYEHPHLILFQPNFATLQKAFHQDDWNKVLSELSNSAEALAKMGADFVIIPANTVHKVITDLQNRCSIPILNMLELVADECHAKKMKKVAILGTVWTMSGHLYKNTLAARGIEEIIPSEQDQKIIQDAIFLEIIPTGTATPPTVAAVLTVVESLKQSGCDGIALACTELPLILNESNCGIPVIDTTEILAKAALIQASALKKTN